MKTHRHLSFRECVEIVDVFSVVFQAFLCYSLNGWAILSTDLTYGRVYHSLTFATMTWQEVLCYQLVYEWP